MICLDETDQRLPDGGDVDRGAGDNRLVGWLLFVRPIFVSASVAKRRLAEDALSFSVVLVGLIVTSAANSMAVSVAGGFVVGLLAGFLSGRIWPLQGEAPDRRQWVLFLALIIIPCGAVLGAVLVHEVGQHDLTACYLLSCGLGFLCDAVARLLAANKRVSE
jgi:uncharacterized membrane protein YoaK (UPF0700 family)